MPGFNGPEPVTWQELNAWAQLTCSKITPWEASAIIRLSRCYVDQIHRSRSPDCPAPINEIDGLDLDKQRERIAQAFKSMAKIKSAR